MSCAWKPLTAAGIDFRTNTTVIKADIKAKTITTESGEDITYEKLIIALGSVVRPWYLTCPRSFDKVA